MCKKIEENFRTVRATFDSKQNRFKSKTKWLTCAIFSERNENEK